MPFSPSYFGPNALPIPDFYSGRIDSLSHVSIATDTYWGSPDYTQNLFVKTDWVLLPKKICFSVWMVPMEYYSINRQSAIQRGLNADQLNGFAVGDVYVGTFFSVCKEGKYRPGIVLGAVIKSASGGEVDKARYHDTPGYYFDVSLGKRILDDTRNRVSIDVALTTGFLCWQTSKFRQNDAVMWGARVGVNYRDFQFTNELGGYIGWQQNGDTPMAFKSELTYNLKPLSIFVRYQLGILDFPYQQVRLGLSIPFKLDFEKK